MRDHSSQWRYPPQGNPASYHYDFVTKHRSRGKGRISSQRRILNRRAGQSVAVATIEALIAIINMLESD